MAELRAVADALELATGKDYWPFPTYADLLFGVNWTRTGSVRYGARNLFLILLYWQRALPRKRQRLLSILGQIYNYVCSSFQQASHKVCLPWERSSFFHHIVRTALFWDKSSVFPLAHPRREHLPLEDFFVCDNLQAVRSSPTHPSVAPSFSLRFFLFQHHSFLELYQVVFSL